MCPLFQSRGRSASTSLDTALLQSREDMQRAKTHLVRWIHDTWSKQIMTLEANKVKHMYQATHMRKHAHQLCIPTWWTAQAASPPLDSDYSPLHSPHISLIPNITYCYYTQQHFHQPATIHSCSSHHIMSRSGVGDLHHGYWSAAACCSDMLLNQGAVCTHSHTKMHALNCQCRATARRGLP